MIAHRTEPHAEHTVEVLEDDPDVRHRLYRISTAQGAIGFTGEELESVFAW